MTAKKPATKTTDNNRKGGRTSGLMLGPRHNVVTCGLVAEFKPLDVSKREYAHLRMKSEREFVTLTSAVRIWREDA